MSFRQAFQKVVQAVKEAVTIPEGFFAEPKPVPIRVTYDSRAHQKPYRPHHW